jgi:hypothetical protein
MLSCQTWSNYLSRTARGWPPGMSCSSCGVASSALALIYPVMESFGGQSIPWPRSRHMLSIIIMAAAARAQLLMVLGAMHLVTREYIGVNPYIKPCVAGLTDDAAECTAATTALLAERALGTAGRGRHVRLCSGWFAGLAGRGATQKDTTARYTTLNAKNSRKSTKPWPFHARSNGHKRTMVGRHVLADHRVAMSQPFTTGSSPPRRLPQH